MRGNRVRKLYTKAVTIPWRLKKTGFQERLAPEDRALFREVCPPQRHEANSCVFRAGDPALSLHVVDAGQIKLVLPNIEGKERILALCGPGDLIGETFLSGAHRYQADAVTLTEVVTCSMSREQFLQLTGASATFALTFSEVLADHLLHCRTLLGTGFDPVKVRVKVLLNMTQHFGRPLEEPGWYQLETQLTHEDLASMVTATRVAVSNTLAELRREGMVEGTRGHYRLDVQRLETLLDGHNL